MTQPEPQPAGEEGAAIRASLVADAAEATTRPDLAAQVYQSVGIDDPTVFLHGVRSKMSEIQPGDLVGWAGGQEPDGRYVGNLAVYAGNREIIEKYYGTTRRRKLGPMENTFGMPVGRNEQMPQQL